MTREEREDSIDIIQSILNKYEEDECLVTEITIGDEDIEALKLAIKALEQEPTTKNDLGVDCIDRKATLDAIIKRLVIKNETYLLEGERVIYQQILAMPSVTPQEPKTGHWIVQPSNKEQGERDFIWWKCSECGQVIFSETLHDRLEFHAFCGRCGADMKEVEK